MLAVMRALTSRTIAGTLLALLAFAGNSVLCRMALGGASIDPAGFTILRLVAGAASLWLWVGLGRHRWQVGLSGRRLISGLWLAVYAVGFSIAYLELTTGTGALILFGAVQLTMLIGGALRGERPGWKECLGAASALGGLVYLLSPTVERPTPTSGLLMLVAGIAWGLYSLRGRGAADPVEETAGNFVAALPWALLALLPFYGRLAVSSEGAWLAVISGAVTSGLGYVVWYSVVGRLTATQAATAQLTVPVLTAAAGVAALGEAISPRWVLAAILVLGGAALTLGRRSG